MSTEPKLPSPWYVPATISRYPREGEFDEPGFVDKHILTGWAPPRPVLHRGDKVLAVGSCFARQLAYGLVKRGMSHENTHLFVFDGRLVTSFAMLRHLRWALGLQEIDSDETLYVEDKTDLSVGARIEGNALIGRRCSAIPLDDQTRELTRKVIEDSAAFIFTLGLSEYWHNRETGEPFIKAVPSLLYDPNKHAYRVSSVEENRVAIEQIIATVRSVKPHAPIVLTLSPQPLAATFRDVSCTTANCVSKAVLRVAIDEIMRERSDPNLYYWPSYEIVTLVYGRSAYRGDGRHIHQDVAMRVVELFDRYFVAP